MVDYSRFNNIVIDSDSEESSDDEPSPAPSPARAPAPAPAMVPPRRHYEAVMAEYQCLYFPEAVACLSRGEAYSRTYAWSPPSPQGTGGSGGSGGSGGGGGSGGSGGAAWSIRTRRGPILKNSIMNSTDNSHIGWKRELNLTLHAGQHLPEAMYGANSIEFLHEASGVRLSFCALEALRAWALLDETPVKHLAPNAKAHEWDYTFTTMYAGSVSVAGLGEGVPAYTNATSLYPRPAVEIYAGDGTLLRKPLCNCVNGRTPLVADKRTQNATCGAPASGPDSHIPPPPPRTPPPPPTWQPTDEVVDFDAILAGGGGGGGEVLFGDSIDFWLNNLDPHSLSFLRGRVLVMERAWLCEIRCFVRVNGVMARIVETRFICRGNTVLRERSWREGDWATLVGPERASDPYCFLGGLTSGIGDDVAFRRLPQSPLRPPTTEVLLLPTIPLPPVTEVLAVPRLLATLAAGGDGDADGDGDGGGSDGGGKVLSVLWAREVACEVMTTAHGSRDDIEGTVLVVMDGGCSVEAINAVTGETRWREEVDGSAAVVAAALSPSGANGGRLALGTHLSVCHVWRATTGEPLDSFNVAVPADVIAVDGDAAGGSGSIAAARCGSGGGGGGSGGGGGVKRARQRRMCRDVEHFAWSADGVHMAAAAGRDAVVVSVAQGEGEGEGGSGSGGEGGGGGAVGVSVEGVLSSGTGTIYELSFANPVTEAGTAAGVADSGAAVAGVAVGSYGGVGWLPVTSGTVVTKAQPTFEIGSTAVLSVAVSFDGALLAVGCMDKRARVFNVAAGAGAGAGPGPGLGAAAQAGVPPSAGVVGATDWVGFDGPVKVVAWSKPNSSSNDADAIRTNSKRNSRNSRNGRDERNERNEWLAAAGGSNLMVAPRSLVPGDSPVLCVAPGAEGGGITRPRWARLAWAPAVRPAGTAWRGTERLLAAMEESSGLTHLFDVAAADGSVPRRASPIATVVPPGMGVAPVLGLGAGGGGGRSVGDFHEQLLKVAFVTEGGYANDEGEGPGEDGAKVRGLVLAVSWGSCVCSCRVDTS